MMIDTIREIGVARKIGSMTVADVVKVTEYLTGAEDIPGSARVLRRPRRT